MTMATQNSMKYQPLDVARKGMNAPRRFELCMVFKYKTSKNVKFEETADSELGTVGGRMQMREPTLDAKNKMQVWKQRREALLKQLKNCGLNLFCYYSRDRDQIFCKIGADAEKLQSTAARMKYKLQMTAEYLSAYAEYRRDIHGKAGNVKAQKFYSQMYERHGDDAEFLDESAIFTTRDKIFLINHMITSKDKDCAGVNIGQLLHADGDKNEGLLKHYFPLHEEKRLKELTNHKWFNWVLMDTEHTHKVRDYFGDKVCFYYLWMSFYWKWMLIPGLVGAALQVLDVCFRTPDNMTAVPFCIFLAIWSSFLPHFWRRQEAKYAIAWGTFDLAPDLEPCRPEHFGEPRINPVTAQVEPYYPWQKRMWQYMISTAVIVLSGVILIFAILILLFWRHKYHDVEGGIITWQFIMAIFVEIVNACLTWLAKKLTDLENHRTQSDHDTQLLAKVFAFKFVNSYFVLYYCGFFKRHSYLFGVNLTCMHGRFSTTPDCFLDLQCALAIFFIVRLLSQCLARFVTPKFRMWIKSFQENKRTFFHNLLNATSRLELADMSQAERESKRTPYDPFQDFDETLITHGYATLFSVTSPWVCTATLLWIIGETILDVRGLTDMTQRPLPIRMRNNEPWDTAFDIYGFLATITNITVIIFASEEYGNWRATEKLMLFIMMFHVIIFAKIVIKAIFPDVPRSVELLHLKQQHMVHRCMENLKAEPQQDLSQFIADKSSGFEVLEQDIMDDEEVEPELDLVGSARTLQTGMRSTLDRGLLCILCVTVGLTLLMALGLFIYNKVGGRIDA